MDFYLLGLPLPHNLCTANSVYMIQFHTRLVNPFLNPMIILIVFSPLLSHAFEPVSTTESQCLNLVVTQPHLCWLLEDKKYFCYCCAFST